MSDPAFQSHTPVEQPRTIDDPEKKQHSEQHI